VDVAEFYQHFQVFVYLVDGVEVDFQAVVQRGQVKVAAGVDASIGTGVGGKTIEVA
jgi:hypothetical protein